MKIGWARTDTTPDRPNNLRGQFNVRISNRVNDPLYATALALEKDGQTAVLVGLDRVGVPAPIELRIREAVAARLPGFDPRNLILNATHTHTAPELRNTTYPESGPEVMTPDEYAAFFVERVTEAIVQAWECRTEGGVSWGYGHAVVGHNRRLTYMGGTSVMYGKSDRADFSHVEGYEDHGVDLLYTWDPQGELTGVIVNLACPSQVTEGELYVSSDFWHEARLEIAKGVGDGVFVLPQCAPAGDQSPHLLLEQKSEALMRERRGLTEREEIGRRIGNAVADVLPLAATDIQYDPVFAHTVTVVKLPVRMVTRGEYDEALAKLAEWEATPADRSDMNAFSYRHVMIVRCKQTIERYESQDGSTCYPTDVHALRIGDVAMATNPFELFLDYGLRMKARSAATQTFLVQLCGSGHAESRACYLATARAVAARSYGAEVVDTIVGPEGGQRLVDRTVELVNELW
ncbi:MAG: hypothetical protein WCP21_10395 [Armatimonadota bacterium]